MTNISDEQDRTAAFEQLVGGVPRAQQLFRLFKSSYPGIPLGPFDKPPSQAEVFRRRALAAGFTAPEIDALLALQ